MKNFSPSKVIFIPLLLFITCVSVTAQQHPIPKSELQQSFNLVPELARDTQFYMMESKLLKYSLDGTRRGYDIYRLYLRCVPAGKTSVKGDEYTCLKFTVQLSDSPEVAIPALVGWKYFFSIAANTGDEKHVFGIDQHKFDRVVDANGKVLQVENSYHVYNAFIDFHSMSVFSEKTPTGKGVQDLKHIGEKIIHSASFSQPAVDSGGQVGEGSYFKNGEITLAFKGLSLVNKKTCAILGYDSGESSFNMVVKPMPNMEVKTKGSSHYQGDIYKDLAGGWIQRAILNELVISETVVPGMANKINTVIERSITINNVARIAF